MRDLRYSINCSLALLLFSVAPLNSAAPPDLKLIALIPPRAQVMSGISAMPHEQQPDYFVLLTHNNAVDLQDLLALCGADRSRTIRQVVFVAIADRDGELREHSLLASGHFDRERITNRLPRTEQSLFAIEESRFSKSSLLHARETHSNVFVGLRSSTRMSWCSGRSQPCAGNWIGIRIAVRLTHRY